MDRSQHKRHKPERRQARGGRFSADAERRQREQDLPDLIEAIQNIAWTIRWDSPDVFASKGWTEYTGLAAEALSGSAWFAVIHRDERAFRTTRRRTSVTACVPFENGARLRRAGAEYRWHFAWRVIRDMPVSQLLSRP